MRVLTQDALLLCDHALGRVSIDATQDWVTIAGRRILVRPDPEGRTIEGCPNVGPTIKPCTLTMPVLRGYSAFVTVAGRAVCLDAVTGLTDGTPPGVVRYGVKNAGQTFVSSNS